MRFRYLTRRLKGGRGLALRVPIPQVPRHVELRDHGDPGTLARDERREAVGVAGLNLGKIGREGEQGEDGYHFRNSPP